MKVDNFDKICAVLSLMDSEVRGIRSLCAQMYVLKYLNLINMKFVKKHAGVFCSNFNCFDCFHIDNEKRYGLRTELRYVSCGSYRSFITIFDSSEMNFPKDKYARIFNLDLCDINSIRLFLNLLNSYCTDDLIFLAMFLFDQENSRENKQSYLHFDTIKRCLSIYDKTTSVLPTILKDIIYDFKELKETIQEYENETGNVGCLN